MTPRCADRAGICDKSGVIENVLLQMFQCGLAATVDEECFENGNSVYSNYNSSMNSPQVVPNLNTFFVLLFGKMLQLTFL